MASGGQERSPTSAELQESQGTKKGSKKKSPKSGKDKKKTTVAECDRVIEMTDEELAELQAQEAPQPARRRHVSVPKQRTGVLGFFRKEASRHETSEKSDKTPKQAVEKTPKTPEKSDSAQATSLSPGASAQPGRSPGMQSGGDTEDESEGTKKDRSSKKSPSIFRKFFKPRSRDTSPEKTMTSPQKGVSPGKKSGFRGKKSGKSPAKSGPASPGSSPSTPSEITPEECISSLVASTHVCASVPILAMTDKRSLFSPKAKSARNIPVIVEVEEVSVSSSSSISGDVPPAIEETSQLGLTLPTVESRSVSPSKHGSPLVLSGERDSNIPSVGTGPSEQGIPTQQTQALGLSSERDPNMPSVGPSPSDQDIATQQTQALGLSSERDPNMPSVEISPVVQDIPTEHTPPVELRGVRIRNIPSVGAVQDLSAFDMPLISSNIPENMAESSEYDRPRSSSGSTALKGLLTSKSKRNKSVDREDKKEKDKDKDKKRGFFEQFRPRSKSDVSGLKRPAKKSSLPTDRSMDESALTAQSNLKALTGSQEIITPMGQILEGQMLNVPDEDRTRHKSGSSGVRDGSFMSKIRTFSTSESKPPKSPKRPIQSQRSLSPPSSPRADRSGLSPLKLQSGEPRSAPPGLHRGNVFGDREQTHAPYRPDVLSRMAAELGDRMEVEDTDDNIDQAFSKFMRSHRCYDIIPTSAKLVIFDTHLNVKKAFFALIYNDVRAAPLWDTELQDYVGMLTITDFIAILRRLYVSPNIRMDQLEDHEILNWREMQGTRLQPFICIGPDASLYDAVKSLVQNRVHRLPVVDEASGNALYILTHKRILRFLYMFLRNLRTPSFMQSSLRDLGIGTYTNVITTTLETKIITALNLFMDHRVSALPVVNSSGEVINIYAKFDVITLAAAKSYNNLDITIEEALKTRRTGEGTEPVATCFLSETLSALIERIVKAEVHRLVIVDEKNHVEGILSLSDILKYIILRPMGEAASAVATEHAPEDQPPLEPAIIEEASLLEPELMGAEASESSQALS